ncbi:DNA polymerase III subunit delta' [Prodigiosinella aquatilis]|nr:DNA polymerase III subunit delta' [Prodigiosinella sp. LS101]WJV52110.1 DNA polymerase III subunit delta' [Prodigiosinella sp. LS101]WJV56468.1 DNA polymerase III subunit delta' [Pectobacteriaceae bacterium C111]
MEWYPWLNSSYRQLLGQYQSGRGHHALLIHALTGMGDASLVYALGRWLLCQQREGIKSCGKCHSCQLMRAGTHPDWHVLRPEKGKQSLGVDAVRDVLETIYQHARQGGVKLIWLPLAESLTEAAANALLKTLEEPPMETYFLLGCREPSRLLSTFRSRCLYHYLDVPDEAYSVQWLSSHYPMDSQATLTALRLYAGAPLAAAKLLQPEHWKPRQTLCLTLSDCLTQRNFLPLVTPLNHEDVDDRIHWLSALLLDAIKCQHGAEDYLVNQDQLHLVQQLANTLDSDRLHHELRQWLQCRHQLRAITGVNRELLLTERLLNWEQNLSVATLLPSHPFSV